MPTLAQSWYRQIFAVPLLVAKAVGSPIALMLVLLALLFLLSVTSIVGAAWVSNDAIYWRHLFLEVGVGILLFLVVMLFSWHHLSWWARGVIVALSLGMLVLGAHVTPWHWRHHEYWEMLFIDLGVAFGLFVVLELSVSAALGHLFVQQMESDLSNPEFLDEFAEYMNEAAHGAHREDGGT